MLRGRKVTKSLTTSAVKNFRSSNKAGFWKRFWRSRMLYVLLIPAIGGAIVFNYYPTLTAMFRSFYAWDGRRSNFIGLANFEYFFTDPALIQSIWNITRLLIFAVVTTLTFPLMVAYFIFHLPSKRFQYIYRIIFVLPMVVPGIVTTLEWRWIYSNNGVINFLLRLVGLGDLARPWLADFDTALYALMFMGFPWIGGVGMLWFLAGFLSISREVLDAATVDGAGGFKRFWFIELPLVRGQIKLQLMLTCISTIQGFGRELIMTNGGPGYETVTPGLRMYQAGVESGELGYASAIGLVLFVVIVTLTIINQRFIKGSSELS
jgi:raffinose/stachyose/melibiose transport system permease protein